MHTERLAPPATAHRTMRIRTQLALALFALAVLPLAGIVSYSYWTSRQAVERALQAESEAMADQLTGRLATVRGELRRRLEALGGLPFEQVAKLALDPGAAAPPGWLEQVAAVMGDSAALVGTLEVRSPPPEPSPGTGPEAPPAAPAPPVLPDSVLIIDLPEILRMSMEGALAATPDALREAQAGIAEARAEIAREREARARMRRRGQLPGKDPAPGIDPDTPVAPSPPSPPKAPAEPFSRSVEALAHAAEVMALRISEEALRVAEETARGMAVTDPGMEALADRIRSVVTVRERSARQEGLAPHAGELIVEVHPEGAPATELRAAVRRDLLLRRVLEEGSGAEGEMAFAVERDGSIHLADPAAATKLGDLPLQAASATSEGDPITSVLGDWMVASTRDADSGITFGVARPLREPLQALRRTAARNFLWGLALVSLALLGVLPLATHLTRDLAQVSAGAERIASGDLAARVPVRSKSEVGALAATFNRMAQDLANNQERLVEQRLLEAELGRRARELEEARQLQLSLLPRTVPRLPGLAIAVSMRTATEVGGDYYDFQTGDDGALVVAIGDATGHGAQAGTMVTVLKGLFSAWPGGSDLAGFLSLADTALRRMDLGRMLMAFALLRVEGTHITVASAGMPPLLVWRDLTRQVEEIDLPGLPLGGSLRGAYQQRALDHLAPGDAMVLMSDGLAELEDPQGEVFGYERIRERLGELGDRSAEEILSGLVETAEAWAAGRPAGDDLTFVVLRLSGSPGSPTG